MPGGLRCVDTTHAMSVGYNLRDTLRLCLLQDKLRDDIHIYSFVVILDRPHITHFSICIQTFRRLNPIEIAEHRKHDNSSIVFYKIFWFIDIMEHWLCLR